MRKKMLPLLLTVLMTVSLAACGAEEPMMPERQTSKVSLERPTPGENYYGYVNYEYITTGQIPHDRAGISAFDDISRAMEEEVSAIIDELAAGTSTDPFEANVRELYLQYLDIDAREKAGYEPLLPVIGMIEAAETPDELIAAMGVSFQQYGVSSFFRFEVQPDMYDATHNKLLLFHMNSCGNMKENFTRRDEGAEQIGSLTYTTLTGLKVANEEAKTRARAVTALVNEIMYATVDSADMRNMEKHYKPVNAESFKKLYSNIDAKALIKAFGFTADDLLVYDMGQSEKINELFTAENLRALKDYALACLDFEYGKVMPPSFTDASSEENKTEEELQKEAKNFVGEKLEEDLGIIYGKKHFTKEIEADGKKMVSDIQTAARKLIQNCGRLSENTRKNFLKKLDNMVVMLGYNKNYQPPYAVIPSGDGGGLMLNLIGINRTRAQEEIAKLSQPVNREIWKMSPLTVNAVYNPQANSVTIPAVMFSKASYDPEKGEAYNLGGLGYVVAHEIHHAFDSNGSLYDEIGTYDPTIMDEPDRKAFEELQEKAKTYYHNYKIVGIYNINGEQTLGENLADLGAIQCVSTIPQTKEELQKLFEGVGEQWAELVPVTNVLIQLESDEHSPGEARVNAVVSSTDRFYEAYEIKESDKMYVAPENRVKVW